MQIFNQLFFNKQANFRYFLEENSDTLRSKTIDRISKYTKLSSQECEDLPILSYLPIQNHTIGIDWFLNTQHLSIKDIVGRWFILLCVNNEFFSSDEFMTDINLNLSNRKYEELCVNMAVFISTQPESYPPFKKIRNQKHIKIHLDYIIDQKNNYNILPYIRSKSITLCGNRMNFGCYSIKCTSIKNFYKFTIDLEDHFFCLMTPKKKSNQSKSFKFLPDTDCDYLISKYREEIAAFEKNKRNELANKNT